MILAQLTDTHIRSRRQIAYGRVDTCSMFETTISHINSFRPNVDAVIVTGDITDRGELDAFHLFREIINDLVPPWYVVPGNHDNRENFLQVFSDCQHFNQNSDFICYSIEDYPVRLVGIDTTVENKPYGFLAEERLLWLDTCLAENPEKPTILFQHHPPFYTGINHMDVQNLLNGRELIQLLTRHRQVRHVACGHVHRASETCIDGVGISIAPTTASELRSQILVEGEGSSAQAGNQVTVHYTGKLVDGTVFDSSLDRMQPFVFTLGQGEVIKGWDRGVNGMKVGEKRLLTIPPELGYGAVGAGSLIPPNATLVFEVELLSVSSPPKLIGAASAKFLDAQKNDLEDESQYLFSDSAEEIDEEDQGFGISPEMQEVQKQN